MAVALLLIAAVMWSRRNRIHDEQDRTGSMFHAFTLLRRPRFAMGAACIFLYVGAEVSIGSMMVAYLIQGDVWAVDRQTAGNHVSFYWGGAMVGRFVGAWALGKVSPGWALLAIGLMNSIMFPTIFSLASEGLGARSAEGSGVIATAIVGGAVVPYLTGRLANGSGLHLALLLPALCYLCIATYGLYARRPAIA